MCQHVQNMNLCYFTVSRMHLHSCMRCSRESHAPPLTSSIASVKTKSSTSLGLRHRPYRHRRRFSKAQVPRREPRRPRHHLAKRSEPPPPLASVALPTSLAEVATRPSQPRRWLRASFSCSLGRICDHRRAAPPPRRRAAVVRPPAVQFATSIFCTLLTHIVFHN